MDKNIIEWKPGAIVVNKHDVPSKEAVMLVMGYNMKGKCITKKLFAKGDRIENDYEDLFYYKIFNINVTRLDIDRAMERL